MTVLLVLRFAWQDLRYDWRRSLLNLVKLAVMACTYLLVAALGQAFQAFSSSAAASAHNLLILSNTMLEPSESSLPPELLEQAVQAVQTQFGAQAVRDSAPVLFQHLNLEQQVLQVMAVPENSFEPIFQLVLLEGDWPTGPGQAVVSRGAAQSGGWHVGQQVEIYGQPVVLSGIIESTSRGTASIWMNWATGEQTLGLRRGIQIGVLQLDPQADLPAIQAWLETSPLLQGRYAVYQESQVNELLNRAILGIRPMGEIFRWMALLVLVFGGFSVASLTLLERQAEVALLHHVGFSGQAIRGFVLCRTALLALLAYPMGWAAAWLLQQPQRSGLVIYGAHLDIALNNQTTWLGLALVLASTLVGAWLAVRHGQAHTAAEAEP